MTGLSNNLPDRSNHRTRVGCPNYVRPTIDKPNACPAVSGVQIGIVGPTADLEKPIANLPGGDEEDCKYRFNSNGNWGCTSDLESPIAIFHGAVAEIHCGHEKSDDDLQNFDNFRLANPQTLLLRSKRDRILGLQCQFAPLWPRFAPLGSLLLFLACELRAF